MGADLFLWLDGRTDTTKRTVAPRSFVNVPRYVAGIERNCM